MDSTHAQDTDHSESSQAHQLYCIFTLELPDSSPVQLSGNLSIRRWRPSCREIVPPGLKWAHALWWIAHYSRLFRNRDYSIYMVMDGNRVAHRSCVIPSCFRWPFMAADDLQISSTWTEPDYRGAGLATAALQQIVNDLQHEGRRFWYISRPENPASISVCRKSGFTHYGMGRRRARFGLRLLGQFTLDRTEGALAGDWSRPA